MLVLVSHLCICLVCSFSPIILVDFPDSSMPFDEHKLVARFT